MAKKLIKKQTGGVSSGQRAQQKMDSLYNANKARTKAMYDSMMKSVPKAQAPKAKDSTKVTITKKKMGGSSKSKKC
jgi:hypothetical protein